MLVLESLTILYYSCTVHWINLLFMISFHLCKRGYIESMTYSTLLPSTQQCYDDLSAAPTCWLESYPFFVT